MRHVRGHLWLIKRRGVGTWWRYERARRSGLLIDYSRYFTPNQLAVLEEHGLSMWGKRL
jgi:hypothetical protein